MGNATLTASSSSGSGFTRSVTRSHHGSWRTGKIPRSSEPCSGGQILDMLTHYAHGFKSDKLEAQGAVLDKLVKSGVKSGVRNH
jgi:hypothetical protein